MNMPMQTPPRRTSPDRRPRRGQAAVLFALLIIPLVGTTGLVVDSGMAFVHRRQVQNAADIATLDGTLVLARHYDSMTPYCNQAQDAAVQAAVRNGVSNPYQIPAGETTPNVWVRLVDFNGQTVACGAPTLRGVAVQVRQDYPTAFMRAVGIGSVRILTPASSHYGFVGQMFGALPIVVNIDALPANPNDGQEHLAVLSPAGGGAGPVNFGGIDPTAYGQTRFDAFDKGLRINVVSGQGCVPTGSSSAVPCTATSVQTIDAAEVNGVQDRINSAPAETWNHHAEGSRRVATLLVINGDIGNPTVIPVGIALVFLDAIDGGASQTLTLHFIAGVIRPDGARIDPSITNPTPGTPVIVQLNG
jgi:Flp pilus assembly protein TadG